MVAARDPFAHSFVSMPLVRLNIMLGSKLLGAPKRPFEGTATIEKVIKTLLEPFADCTVTSLEQFPTAQLERAKKSELYPADFDKMTVDEVAEDGLYWVATVVRPTTSTPGMETPAAATAATSCGGSSSGGGGSSELPNSLAAMMERESGQAAAWPARAIGSTFQPRLFNSLIDLLKARGLGWHYADCSPNGSGTKLLRALAFALAYLLPFDIKGTLTRRAMHIPATFTADTLKVHSLSQIPSPPLSRSLSLIIIVATSSIPARLLGACGCCQVRTCWFYHAVGELAQL